MTLSPTRALPRPAQRVIPSADGSTAAEVLGEIRRLYHALEALPCTGYRQGRPSPGRLQSPAYLALQAQIRLLADRFKQLERAPLTLVRV